MRQPCPHCWPSQRYTHLPSHIEHYLELAISPIRWLGGGLTRRFLARPKRAIHGPRQLSAAMRLLQAVRFMKLVEDFPVEQFHNRSLIFTKEAQRQGIAVRAVKLFGRYTNHFVFTHQGKSYYYEAIPLTVFGAATEWDDKEALKQLLQHHQLPTAEGRSFSSVVAGLAYGEQLGYPLVVKPKSGSLSHHTTVNIVNRDQLKRAIKIAKQYQPSYVVERYIAGKLYRVTVIGQETVFVCQKTEPQVIGDGKRTIAELIVEKNQQPLRQPRQQKNATLHRLELDEHAHQVLESQGLGVSSVPKTGQIVQLSDKLTLSAGCDVVNCTKIIHPTTVKLLINLAKHLNVQLVGIDIICQDISRPYTEQTFVILETNSLPYIDMHQHPSEGQADPVARQVWKMVLARL